MYNACEWGNYCRVQETGLRSRQLGRRAIIAYSAIVVPPESVYTPPQLANRTIGVPFFDLVDLAVQTQAHHRGERP